MQNNKFGYIRVSTLEQNDHRQRLALEAFCIPKRNLYIDKISGKNFERPAYSKLIKHLKKGDILYIKSIDRLGRNYTEIQEQWRIITRIIGSDIKIVDMPLLDTTYAKDLLGTFISDLILQVLSFASQNERENILLRQKEGIAAAKARGVTFGRQAKQTPKNFIKIYESWRSGKISIHQAAALCGFSERTLYAKTKSMRKIDNHTCKRQ